MANLLSILSGAEVPEDSSGEQSHAEEMGANREGNFPRWFIFSPPATAAMLTVWQSNAVYILAV